MRARVTLAVALLLLVTGLAGSVRLLTRAAPAAGRPVGTSVSGPAPRPALPPVASYRRPRDGVALPDGFVPRRLTAGERPPQFVVVSFDGGGWHEGWRRWLDLADRVPFRFTAFLSGTYLLSDRSRLRYRPPGYPAGTSAIGWRSAAELPVEVADLNRAAAAGMEIGTHFNGHFCSTTGLPSGGDTWATADWNAELDQFFALLANVRPNNRLSAPRLQTGRGDILGARTPCLEGDPAQLYPALRQHALEYDASSTTTGLVWPRRDRSGLWLVGMPVYPVHGTLPDGRTGVPVTAMDYNYFFTQRGASSFGVTPAESAADRRQVLATYRDMYRAAYRGNRAPIVLGNHFNDWNDDAYTRALATFVEQTCGRPDTECVPFRDLVVWLDVQTPRTLQRLAALPGEGG